MSATIDDSLRRLDAAQATPLTPEQLDRAETSLNRIMSCEPVAHTPARPTPIRRLVTRRRVIIPLAATALAAGYLVLPRGGNESPAYASWTPIPAAVSPTDVDVVKRACVDQLGKHDHSPFELGKASVVLAERRGDVVVLLYRTDNPDMSASCVAVNRPGSRDVEDVSSAIGGGSGPAQKAPANSFIEGSISQFGGPYKASITDGAVGPGVVGVTIHAGSTAVRASVNNGRYVAWWPGQAFADGPLPPSGEGGPASILSYDLTLTNGQVLKNAQSARPS